MDKTQKVELISIGATFVLFAFKFLTYKITGSVAILADAVHSFSDSFTSILVLIGISFSRRKTKTFPYGLYKLENLVSLFVSFAIFYTGYEIIRESIFSGGYSVTHKSAAILVSLVSAFASLSLARYKLKVGREYNSPGLIADGKHSQSDALSSIVVMAGIIANADRIAAAVVSLFIFKSAFEPLIDSLKVLLDASVEPDILERVREVLLSDPRVKKIKKLAGRNSGRYRFIEAIIEVNVRDFRIAHKLSEELELKIKESVPNVDEVLIHYEPVESDETRIAVPLMDESSVSPQLGTAQEFLIVRLKNGEIVEKKFIKNPFVNLSKGRGKVIGELLMREGVNYVVLQSEPAGGSKYILEGLGITILIVKEKEPSSAINKAIELIKEY